MYESVSKIDGAPTKPNTQAFPETKLTNLRLDW